MRVAKGTKLRCNDSSIDMFKNDVGNKFLK
jgi:hypothetical protein